MRTPKKGKRHPLLMYRRTMDRMWIYTLVLGLEFAAVSRWSLIQESEIYGISSNFWITLIAVLAILVSLFAFCTRFFAYVQAEQSTLLINTPFLRLRVAYRRMSSVHPVLIQQMFPINESSWSQRSYLDPLYGKTALLIEMRSLPMNRTYLRLFLPKEMFSKHAIGFVVLVPDWMKLSTELDSFKGVWLQNESVRLRESQVLR
jgi:hypothetical protein